jgi:nitrogen regulatory protein PII
MHCDHDVWLASASGLHYPPFSRYDGPLAVRVPPRATIRSPVPHVKQVIAIVKPFLVEQILDSLRRAPLEAVEVREVKGYGKQKSYLDQYTDSEYSQAFLPKVEIVLWVDDLRVEEVIRKVVDIARTGRMGDGKILVLPAESYERVIDLAKARQPVVK